MFSLRSLFRPKPDANQALRPLYDAIVAAGRQPHWYLAGEVPDTLDGRFDMISLIFALVSNRMAQDEAQALAGVHLTEIFVTDMDGQLRQIGFGDMVVGKQVGRMMSALGGRLGAYQSDANSPEFRSALIRNIWRGQTPPDSALDHVAAQAAQIQAALAATAPADLVDMTHIPGSQNA
ncbi:ubiquinol-cytochrome C chaperone family protein [Sphingopyxis yananensis]|uniref:ubiquinol-cytochrome C chaperone family protein n=1 Tax=Sphingopyxis yananensis TaxID=2886687 RepID=UPI001D128736|nr:ubiquinol-cytochrome C chaperone family protein [Sphingopyxis yananensis]MCC2601342.1 ubiquinol-cytochrome C chaperone [Sphingopyxis yananensis]